MLPTGNIRLTPCVADRVVTRSPFMQATDYAERHVPDQLPSPGWYFPLTPVADRVGLTGCQRASVVRAGRQHKANAASFQEGRNM